MENLNFEQANLQSISLNEMVEITGGESAAYDAGYNFGKAFQATMVAYGVYLLFV